MMKQKMDERIKKVLSAKEPDYDKMWEHIKDETILNKQKASTKSLTAVCLKYAALIALPLTVSALLYFGTVQSEQTPVIGLAEVPAGETGAGAIKGVVLKLANGEEYDLSKITDKQLADKGNIVINGNSESTIAYTKSAKNIDTTINNMASVPNGKDYTMMLPDGSKVILNSGSTLRFPTRFGKKERRVILSGEAYFKVVTNPLHPFRVEVVGNVIEAVGTSFNVNAYANATNIEATLVEGKVNVITPARKEVLLPGEQASISEDGIAVKTVDVNDILSWMNGIYSFSGMPVKEIMKQMERWYDVKVQWGDRDWSNYVFTGIINKSLSVKENLKAFEKTSNLKIEYENNIIKFK